MSHTLHIVDAFTDKPFASNPAAVCLLDSPAGETWMKLVAREMNLSDFTAYQASERGGIVKVGVRGERVLLRGQAVMMSKLELRA